MFRPTLVRLARTKVSTGMVGLGVHPTPLQTLIKTYDGTLQKLAASSIPPSSAYRQSVEAITQHRRSLAAAALEQVNTGTDEEAAIKAIEDELDAGLIEDIILQATGEQKLMSQMEEWKVWEDLETKPPVGQWDPVVLPASNNHH